MRNEIIPHIFCLGNTVDEVLGKFGKLIFQFLYTYVDTKYSIQNAEQKKKKKNLERSFLLPATFSADGRRVCKSQYVESW